MHKLVGRTRVINRAYWIIMRMIPLACMCYFGPYVRNVTQVEVCFLRFPVRAAGSNEQFGVVGQHTNKFYRV
jgi:hypothetical protein